MTGNEGIDGPNRKQTQGSPSHRDAAKIFPRSEIPKAGRHKVLGRDLRDGSGGRRPEGKSARTKRQKWKPSFRNDDGDSEPGGKPTLDGIAGLASSPMWLARARARFEKKFYAEGTWTARASKRRKVMEIYEACGGKEMNLTVDTIRCGGGSGSSSTTVGGAILGRAQVDPH